MSATQGVSLLGGSVRETPATARACVCIIALAALGAGFGAGFATGAAVESSTAAADCRIEPSCPSGEFVFQDEHDGDQKQITITGEALTIRPFNNTQAWAVTTTLDASTCAANIDFNVVGKPDPPPVNLTMTIYTLGLRQLKRCSSKQAAIFTDPTGVLAAPGFPLNTWIELPSD